MVLTSAVSPTKYLSLVKVKTSSARSPKDDLWVRDAKYNIGTTNYVNKENYRTDFRILHINIHSNFIFRSYTKGTMSSILLAFA